MGSNWLELVPFAEPDGVDFLVRRNVDPDVATTLVAQAAREVESTPGLIRPITLNMLDVILTRAPAFASSAAVIREGVLSAQLRHWLNEPLVREHAPALLAHMITTVGTKKPRMPVELADLTGFDTATIEGCLVALQVNGIVRRIDAEMWEVSHDFLARLPHAQLSRQGRILGTLRRHWFMAGTFTLWLLGFGVLFVANYSPTVASAVLAVTDWTSGATAERTRQSSLTDFVESLSRVLDARSRLGTAEHNIVGSEQQVRQSQQRFDVGLIGMTDVEEAQFGLVKALAERPFLTQTVSRETRALARVVEAVGDTARAHCIELTSDPIALEDARLWISSQGTHGPELDGYARAIHSSEASRSSIQAGFQVGTRTSLDVIDSESALADAQFLHDRAVVRILSETLTPETRPSDETVKLYRVIASATEDQLDLDAKCGGL